MLDIVNKIIEMSVQASFVICIILIVRFLFLKINIPKRMIYFLWAIPLFRMICPVTIATKYSLMPADLSSISNDMDVPLSDVHLSPALNTVTVSQNAVPIGSTQVEQPSVVVEENGFSLVSWLTGIVNDIANMEWEPIDVFFVVWIVGICVLVAYSIISTLRLRKKLVGSVWVNNNYYRTDYIDTPFVLGIIRPKIYLPSSLSEEDMDMIIKHEEMHLRRKDHIAKIIVFAVTCVHWFNPWAWVLFVLFCRDMESAVDEKVISKFDVKERQSYATLLLALSTGHRHLLSAPLAFGEGDVKGRIKNVVKYKKPVTILVVVAAIVAVVLAIGLMTSQNYLIPKNADAQVAYVNYGEILDAQELLVSEEEEEALVTALRDCKIEWAYKTYMEGLDGEYYDMILYVDNDSYWISLDDNNAYLSENNILYAIDSHGPVYSILEKIRMSEHIEESKVIPGMFVEYTQNDDGTWSAAGYDYKYRLVLAGQWNNAVKGTVYTVLSNDPNITFEDAMWASGISSNMDDYFSPEYAMIVDWQSYDLPEADE